MILLLSWFCAHSLFSSALFTPTLLKDPSLIEFLKPPPLLINWLYSHILAWYNFCFGLFYRR